MSLIVLFLPLYGDNFLTRYQLHCMIGVWAVDGVGAGWPRYKLAVHFPLLPLFVHLFALPHVFFSREPFSWLYTKCFSRSVTQLFWIDSTLWEDALHVPLLSPRASLSSRHTAKAFFALESDFHWLHASALDEKSSCIDIAHYFSHSLIVTFIYYLLIIPSFRMFNSMECIY